MDQDAFRPPGDVRRTDPLSPVSAASPASTTTPTVPAPAAPAAQDSMDRFGTTPRTVREAPSAATPFPGSEAVDPAAVFRGPGYTAPPPPTNGVSSTALWMTVVGVFLPPVLVVSALLGAIGLARAPRLHRVGARAAGGALAVSLVLIGLWALIYVLVHALILGY
jgi:hypothetical protein